MANLTLKNIPDDLYQRLKHSATQHRRSINSEVLACLELALLTPRRDVAATLSRIRELRAQSTTHWLTDADLLAMKDQGRS